MDSATARNILARLHIADGQDFHTLSFSQADELADLSRLHGYRKPKDANGSRARYFYAYLERKARRTE